MIEGETTETVVVIDTGEADKKRREGGVEKAGVIQSPVRIEGLRPDIVVDTQRETDSTQAKGVILLCTCFDRASVPLISS